MSTSDEGQGRDRREYAFFQIGVGFMVLEGWTPGLSIPGHQYPAPSLSPPSLSSYATTSLHSSAIFSSEPYTPIIPSMYPPRTYTSAHRVYARRQQTRSRCVDGGTGVLVHHACSSGLGRAGRRRIAVLG